MAEFCKSKTINLPMMSLGSVDVAETEVVWETYPVHVCLIMDHDLEAEDFMMLCCPSTSLDFPVP